MIATSPSSALHQQPLMDLLDGLNTSLKYRALSNPGLAVGTTTSQVKITNTTVFLNNGVFKSKATADTAFTATTHNILNSVSTVQEAIFLVCLDASGAVTLNMGAIATGSGAALIPAVPTSLTPVGYVRIAVAAGATPFTAASDLLSAGHLTVTYVSLGWLSPRFDAAQ